jgi:hypothetical protein
MGYAMAIEDEVAAFLADPQETVRLDFKEAVNWSSTGGQIVLVRDAVCLANRAGGMIVAGLRDLGAGR